MNEEEGCAEMIARHLLECTDAGAAVVVDGSADAIVAALAAAGQPLREGADLIAGKRIRYLCPPPGKGAPS